MYCFGISWLWGINTDSTKTLCTTPFLVCFDVTTDQIYTFPLHSYGKMNPHNTLLYCFSKSGSKLQHPRILLPWEDLFNKSAVAISKVLTYLNRNNQWNCKFPSMMSLWHQGMEECIAINWKTLHVQKWVQSAYNIQRKHVSRKKIIMYFVSYL